MISLDKVECVRRLLAEGTLSHREIAQRMGISRGSVGTIATGKRLDCFPVHHDADATDFSRPPRRCRGCGGWVYMPCRLCRLRENRARQLAEDRLRLTKLFDRLGRRRVA